MYDDDAGRHVLPRRSSAWLKPVLQETVRIGAARAALFFSAVSAERKS